MVSRSPLLTRSLRSRHGLCPSAVRGREVSDRAARQPLSPAATGGAPSLPPAPHQPWPRLRESRAGFHAHTLTLRFSSCLAIGVAAAALVVWLWR